MNYHTTGNKSEISATAPLLRALLISLLLALPCRADSGAFKAYEYDFATGGEPTVEFKDVANPARKYFTTKDATGMRLVVEGNGLWRGFWGVGQLGTWAGYAPLFGGERLRLSYQYSTSIPAGQPNNTALLVQFFGGETFDMASATDLHADGANHVLEYTLPAAAAGKKICALWLRLDNPGPGGSTLRLGTFSWTRRRINNRLDADRILRAPPLHQAGVADVGGEMAMVVDGRPISGLGWTCLVPHNVGDTEFDAMVAHSGSLMRMIFTLGEQIPLQLYPPSWLGPDQFDFSFLDSQMARILKVQPHCKVLLEVSLEGARWWVWLHPEAGGAAAVSGIPDYLSAWWRHDVRDAIRQMVAHVQTSAYATNVVGYQLMNGSTEDCNFEVNLTTPAAVQRFEDWLRRKYGSDAGLRRAWHQPGVTLLTARPELTPEDRRDAVGPLGPLLLEPARAPALVDKTDFRNHVYQQVILNFAQDIKEATQGRAMVGARTGDLMGNLWEWHDPLGFQQNPIDELLRSRDFDYFEVQEPYVGRGIGDFGSGVPILPPEGLKAHHKLIVIQNDVRTHLSEPTEGFGRTPDVPSTIAVQRRIFVNALVHGLHPYLWQQSYHYNDPQLLANFDRQEQIYQRSLREPRETGAQLAFVYDDDYRRYLGNDPLRSGPSRGFALFDYLKFPWARAGVPYDMIFLDQLATARPYRVYVFVHTVGLSEAQRDLIRRVVRRDGRVAILLWADGLMADGRADAASMSALAGMHIVVSAKARNWKMHASPWFLQAGGAAVGVPLGTLGINEPAEPDAPGNVYAPSFSVEDDRALAIGLYDDAAPGDGATGIAMRRTRNWTSIYSASVNLSPALLRYALKTAGAYSYTDSDDSCYVNRSFIGFHARQSVPSHNIHLRLPSAGALYEVFRDQELPAATAFDIPVEKGETYLYFRGDKRAWDKLAGPPSGVHEPPRG